MILFYCRSIGCSLISSLHPDFHAFGYSAVQINDAVLGGRPHRGTAILHRKSPVEIIDYPDDWITVTILNCNVGLVWMIGVYVPTDYGDNDSIQRYTNTCAKYRALPLTVKDVSFIGVADFNCGINLWFIQLCLIHSEKLCDNGNNTLTYCSDDGCRLSWIDHFVSNLCIDLTVLYDVTEPDHKPMSIKLQLNLHSLSESYASASDAVSIHDC